MKNLLIFGVLYFIRFWARLALTLHKPRIIGIAGSVGKSSTRNALYAAFKDHLKIKMVYGNSETGIPFGILGIKVEDFSFGSWLQMLLFCPFGLFYLQNTDYLIVEMGIDDPYPPHNMEYLLSIVKPHIAISLNISATHTMQFEKLLKENRYKEIKKSDQLNFLLTKIAEEDTKIITQSQCTVGIYNSNNKYIKDSLSSYKSSNLRTFGKEKTNDIWISDYSVSLKGTSFSLILKNNKAVQFTFNDFVLPFAYWEAFAVVCLGAEELQVPLEKVQSSVEKNFNLPKGRASILKGIQNSIIIDSSYNSSKEAVFAFLDLISILKKETKREVVFVFGDMRELGEEAEGEHSDVFAQLPGLVDYLYCVGPLTKEFVIPSINKKQFKGFLWFENSQKAGEYLKNNLPKNSLVLVKGSQNNIYLEEVVAKLLANNSDTSKLCRQNSFWKHKKNKYFSAA